MNLLLTAFGYMEELLAAFSRFHQMIFNFLTAHSPQQLISQLIAHNRFFSQPQHNQINPNLLQIYKIAPMLEVIFILRSYI
jgi:hypothetical protein